MNRILLASLFAFVSYACFALQLGWWPWLITTGMLAVAALTLFIVRRVRARRASAALEQELAAQGYLHVRQAPPDKRAEIQALQQQLSDGVAVIKAAKLGGKRRGLFPLLALPWYAIIGPPGAGKSTALRQSGLAFPWFAGAVPGVGGTRNCDWWFTNEAILLDTAGRYATEHEDQQEWHTFLGLLRKYRRRKPLNGLIVAVSVTDLIDANKAQIAELAMKIRTRIDDVMRRSRMLLPVYCLFTKCDLIAGFSEFFGDLRRSERAQAWGATFLLSEDKRHPGGMFAREYDLLVRHLHARACKRLWREPNRQARDAIFHFPLEFAAMKRNLHDFIAQLFLVNPFQPTPILRGIYFSSATQEGAPLERIASRMRDFMWLRPAPRDAPLRLEPRSYFLRDLFSKIVVADANVAARLPTTTFPVAQSHSPSAVINEMCDSSRPMQACSSAQTTIRGQSWPRTRRIALP